VRVPFIATIATATALGGYGVFQAPQHLNPMVDLHVAKKPVFGLYAPANPRPRGPGAPGGAGGAAAAGPTAATPAPAPKTMAQLAGDAMAYRQADFTFDGSMEHDFERGYPAFAEFVKGMADAGTVEKGAVPRLRLPLSVKTPEIAPDTALAKQRIARQLDLGVSTVVFVSVESADEVRTGIAAMRFKSKGGTRPDAVGTAPALWGMSEQQYREKADVWPLNPKGELTSWAVVETKAGLQRVREIAAVKGLAVLLPGAGTLRGVFSTVDSATKERKLDTAAWEASIQQVLAACKEFDVPCGYPANDPQTVEERMKQGFSVFIAGWGDNGFKAVEHGRKATGR
jgi:4-hydroxy-2-oxoheptanedioate aldolase